MSTFLPAIGPGSGLDYKLQGTSYKADITLKDLIVDINGNPLPLELMMGEMLDMPLADAMTI